MFEDFYSELSILLNSGSFTYELIACIILGILVTLFGLVLIIVVLSIKTLIDFIIDIITNYIKSKREKKDSGGVV